MYRGKYNPEVNAKCPYFVKEAQKSVTCEGLISGSNTMIRFKDEDSKDRHIRNKCLNYPNCCQLARSLDKRY